MGRRFKWGEKKTCLCGGNMIDFMVLCKWRLLWHSMRLRRAKGYKIKEIQERGIQYEVRYRQLNAYFISQYSFINLDKSHIFVLCRYINSCIYIQFHDKLVRNWCGKWENNILGNEFITTDYFHGRIKNYIYGIHTHPLIDLKLYRSPLEHPAGISF